MLRKLGFLLIVSFLFTTCTLYAQELTPEQLVAEHVKSIGAPALLEKIKSQSFIGFPEVKFIQGMQGTMTGQSALVVSQEGHIAIAMNFADKDYPGEYFAYDGNTVSVKNMKPGLRSPIADFIFRFNKIMKQGMVGGVLSTSWPLLKIKEQGAEMKCRKTKVEGREVYELEYRPKDFIGNMTIRMYFDPTTFRHVRTEYKVRTQDDASTNYALGNPDDPREVEMGGIGAVRGESIYILVEKFDDFEKVGGVTLPKKYILNYNIEGTGQSAFIANWTINITQAGFNSKLDDPKMFQAEK